MALMHSRFGARVNQWLLQLRKQNAAVVLATQSPAQLAQLAHRHTIIDSCITQDLPAKPRRADARAGPACIGSSGCERPQKLALIAQATPKRHYYITAPSGTRLFELGLGPVALTFLTAAPGQSPEETRRAVEAVIQAHGPDWPAALLAERGLGGVEARRFRLHRQAQGDQRMNAPASSCRSSSQGAPAHRRCGWSSSPADSPPGGGTRRSRSWAAGSRSTRPTLPGTSSITPVVWSRRPCKASSSRSRCWRCGS